MSGPKIVRIVTREELEAACRALLRTVDASHAELERVARKSGAWNTERAEALASRRQALQGLFDRDRWMELQKQAPAETAFLRGEAEQMVEHAIRRAKSARRRRRRIADAARSVVAALEAEGREAPIPLRRVAESAGRIPEADLPSLEREIDGGISLLRGADQAKSTNRDQREMADRLSAGEQASSYGDWLNSRAGRDDGFDPRLDRLIAEIEVLNDEAAAPYAERAAAIGREPSADRRALLTDSLTIDLSAEIAMERAWQSRLVELAEARATLESLRVGAALVLLDRIPAAIASRSQEQAAAILADVRQLAETAGRREKFQARRRAVLEGLAGLGYEVREEMATSWVAAGRIVVKKPAVADYGVELGAVADGERLQVRVVGAAQPTEARSARRDRDAEVQWCAEVADLQRALAAAGSSFEIESAAEPRAQAVKTADFGGPEAQAEVRARAPLSRSVGG